MLQDRLVPDGVVVTRGSRIEWVGPAQDCVVPEALALASTAQWVVPGFVDLHNHGGDGHDFLEADLNGCRAALKHHRSRGTTTQLASLVSAPLDELEHRLDLLATLAVDGEIAGIHLEGPFLAAARCGAHDVQALLAGDAHSASRLLDAGRATVRTMTVAPDVPGSDEVVTVLRSAGIVPSFGHTDATAATTRAAIGAAGAGTITATHLFNAMSPWDHRSPGAVTACLAAAGRGEMVLELIADGVHVADETATTVFDLVGADHVALVSDSMAAAGRQDGRFRLGSMDVEVIGGVARVAGPDRTIAGSLSSVVDLVQRVVRAGVPLVDAVRSATHVPASVLGLDDVGRLTPGARADLVLLDDDLDPVHVMRAGAWVTTRTS